MLNKKRQSIQTRKIKIIGSQKFFFIKSRLRISYLYIQKYKDKENNKDIKIALILIDIDYIIYVYQIKNHLLIIIIK